MPNLLPPRLVVFALLPLFVGGCSSDADLTLEQAVAKAKEHQAQGEHQEAIRYWTVALERDPKNFGALNNRAAAFTAVKKYDEAFADLSSAIRFGQKKSATPYLNRSALLYNAKMLDEALADIDQAIKIDPQHAEAHWVRGAILMAQDKTAQAEQEVQKAKQLGFKPRTEVPQTTSK